MLLAIQQVLQASPVVISMLEKHLHSLISVGMEIVRERSLKGVNSTGLGLQQKGVLLIIPTV